MAKKLTKKTLTTLSTEALEAMLDNETLTDAEFDLIEQVLVEREEVLEYVFDEVAEAEEVKANEAPAKKAKAKKAEADEVEADEVEEDLPTREQMLNEMEATKGKKAQVVPTGTIEWVDGYIAGILNDKRAKKPMYTVKTDDGRTIRKAYGSDLIKISEEDADKPVRTSRKASAKSNLTDVEIETIKLKMTTQLGKIYVDADKGEATVVGVTHDKRSNSLMYAMRDEEGKRFNRVYSYVDATDAIGYDEDVIASNATRIEYANEILTDPNAKLKFMQDEAKAIKDQIAELTAQLTSLNEKIENYVPVEVEVDADEFN